MLIRQVLLAPLPNLPYSTGNPVFTGHIPRQECVPPVRLANMTSTQVLINCDMGEAYGPWAMVSASICRVTLANIGKL